MRDSCSIRYTLIMRRCVQLTLWMPLVLLQAWLWTAQASAQMFSDKDAAAAATAFIKQAVNKQDDGSHLALLFSLRQMRDPDLKPLFLELATKGDWPMQVHAVIGLAEIDPDRHVDPWLITTKAAAEAQEAIIANSLDQGLLTEDQFQTILAWDKLHPMARLLLMGELVKQHKPVDTEELSRLSHSDDAYYATLASALLAQAGDSGGWTAMQSRIATLKDDERVRLYLWTFEAISRYHLTFAREWVQSLLNDPKVDDDVAYRGVHTLIKLDPAAGLAAWNRSLGENPSHSRRVRYGLSLLAIGPEVPPATYDRLQPGTDDELVLAMVAVGKTQSAGEDPSAAMISLLDIGQMRTVEWVMGRAPDLKPEQSAKIYTHLIDRACEDQATPDAVVLGVKAVAKMFEIDPDGVIARLKAAPDDGAAQQMILLGLFDARSPQIGQVASTLPRMGSGRADSLTLLLMAKNGAALNDKDRQQLGTIAAGAGQVSEILQVQAAWLYLKQTRQIEQALAGVFVEH